MYEASQYVTGKYQFKARVGRLKAGEIAERLTLDVIKEAITAYFRQVAESERMPYDTETACHHAVLHSERRKAAARLEMTDTQIADLFKQAFSELKRKKGIVTVRGGSRGLYQLGPQTGDSRPCAA
jgi:hypothetical protein